MGNHNWIVDLFFGACMALFFLMVTSDVFATDVKNIQLRVGADKYIGFYDENKQEFTLKKVVPAKPGETSFQDLLRERGIRFEKND